MLLRLSCTLHPLSAAGAAKQQWCPVGVVCCGLRSGKSFHSTKGDAQTRCCELAILLTSGFLATAWMDAKISSRDSDGRGLGLHRIFALEALGEKRGSNATQAAVAEAQRRKNAQHRIAIAAYSAAALLLVAVERRILLPTLRGHLAIAPPRCTISDLGTLIFVAGGFARSLRIGGDEISALTLREPQPSRLCSDI